MRRTWHSQVENEDVRIEEPALFRVIAVFVSIS